MNNENDGWIPVEECKIPSPLRLKLISFLEWLSGVRNKNCYACKLFSHYHGSAGICEKKCGCLIVDMRDCFDTCDRDSFIPIAPWGRS